jgi:hypothetical protein
MRVIGHTTHLYLYDRDWDVGPTCDPHVQGPYVQGIKNTLIRKFSTHY